MTTHATMLKVNTQNYAERARSRVPSFRTGATKEMAMFHQAADHVLDAELWFEKLRG